MSTLPEQTRWKKQILLIPVICWMNFPRTPAESRWCGKLNGKAPGCLFSQKDLVSARLCNPKESWQQHLLSERGVRDTARWGSNACCDEFSGCWGAASCWSRTTWVPGVGEVAARWAVWLTVVPQAMGPLQTSLEVSRGHCAVICVNTGLLPCCSHARSGTGLWSAVIWEAFKDPPSNWVACSQRLVVPPSIPVLKIWLK